MAGMIDVIKVICLNGQYGANVEGTEPVFVKGIQQGQILGRNARFNIAGALADAIHQDRYRRFEVDQQVRARQSIYNHIKQPAVGQLITLAQISHVMQGARKDMRVFIYTSVENGGTRIAGGFEVLICAMP